MLAIRLPEEIEKRLEVLAKATGRTKTFYAREAILEYLDDLEDIYLAEKRLEDIRAGRYADRSARRNDDALWHGRLNWIPQQSETWTGLTQKLPAESWNSCTSESPAWIIHAVSVSYCRE